MKNYFTDDELRCKCGCGQLVFDNNMLDILNKIREEYGKPIAVSSGYRCPTHDSSLGGKGNHTTGKAVDIFCNASNRYEFVRLAMKHGVQRIGVAKTFIHLDIIEDKPKPVLWTY